MDDTVLIAGMVQDLQVILNSIVEATEYKVLKLNVKTNKFI